MNVPIEHSILTHIEPAYQTSESIAIGWCPTSKLIGQSDARHPTAPMVWGSCPSQFVDTIDSDLSCMVSEYNFDRVRMSYEPPTSETLNLGGLRAAGGSRTYTPHVTCTPVPSPSQARPTDPSAYKGYESYAAINAARMRDDFEDQESINMAEPMRAWHRRHGSYLNRYHPAK